MSLLGKVVVCSVFLIDFWFFGIIFIWKKIKWLNLMEISFNYISCVMIEKFLD